MMNRKLSMAWEQWQAWYAWAKIPKTAEQIPQEMVQKTIEIIQEHDLECARVKNNIFLSDGGGFAGATAPPSTDTKRDCRSCIG